LRYYFSVLPFCIYLHGGILFDAFSNSLIFPDAELMCQRRLKHLICLSFFLLLLKFSCSMSCTVVVYTPEGFMLAYFVAKKGEKMVYLYSLYTCLCAIMCYSAFILQICLVMPVFSGVAFILQLFQVVCRS
jgi:hypothetical protein